MKKEKPFQHHDLTDGRWAALPLHLQMGNIGSEVSRACKARARGNQRRFDAADAVVVYDRTHPHSARLRELCRAREEFCDYFLGDNEYHTDPVRLQRYYDQFVLLRSSDVDV